MNPEKNRPNLSEEPMRERGRGRRVRPKSRRFETASVLGDAVYEMAKTPIDSLSVGDGTPETVPVRPVARERRGFDISHQERTREYLRRQERRPLFPIAKIPEALFRTRAQDDPAVRSFGEQLTKNPEEMLPPEMRVVVGDETYVDLTLIKHPGTLPMQGLLGIPGAKECLAALSKDLFLSGGDAPEVIAFEKQRREMQYGFMDEMRHHMLREVDLQMELAGDESRHAWESPVEEESYREIETFLQEMVDRLFLAGDMSQFRPRVYLTRELTVNAFVLNQGNEQAVREYAQQGRESKDMVELPIFVNLGLVAAAESPDEIATILAHEFSHLLQPEYLGQKNDDARQRLEYDADLSGMRLADAAGYNPSALIKIFERLKNQSNSPLNKIGWGQHPPTERRVIEARKFLQDRNHPFPSAAKQIPELPKSIISARVFLAEQRQAKEEETKQRLNAFTAIGDTPSAFLDNIHNADSLVFLTKDIRGKFENKGQRIIDNTIVEQEFCYGTLGYRDLMFRALENFILAVEVTKQPHAADESFVVTDPTGVVFPMEDILAHPPKQEITYLPPHISLDDCGIRVGNDQFVREDNNHNELIALLKKTQEGIKIADFEDLLTPTDPRIVAFWERIKTNWRSSDEEAAESRKTMLDTRAGKMSFLFSALNGFMERKTFSSDSRNVPFCAVKKVIKKTKTKKVPIPTRETDESLLGKVAGRARTEQRKDPPRESTDTIEEVEEYTEMKTIFSKSPTTGLDALPKFSLWKDNPREQPALLLREHARVMEQKTLDAYREILATDGFTDVSDETLRYVLWVLVIGNRNTTDIFRHLEHPTIAGLSDALQVLDQKSFKNFFPEYDTARVTLAAAIAFALTPTTAEEVNIQQTLQRRFETDLSLPAELGSRRLGENVPPDVALKTSYTSRREENPERAYMSPIHTRVAAASDRLWEKHGQLFEDWFRLGEIKGLPDMPDAFRTLAPRKEDIDTIAWSFLNSNIFGEPRNKKNIKKYEQHQFDDLAEYIATMLAGMRAYLDMVYAEGIESSSGVSGLQENEIEFLHQDAYTPNKVRISVLAPAVEKLAEYLEAEIGRGSIPMNPDATRADITDFLWAMFRKNTTNEDILARARQMAVIKKKSDEELLNILSSGRTDAEVALLYRSREKPYSHDESYELVSDPKRAIEYLETVHSENPDARVLIGFIEKWMKSKTLKTSGYGKKSYIYLALGYLVPFSSRDGDPFFSKFLTEQETIAYWRAAANLYKDSWKNIEQYKRVDTQLSHWEWVNANPLITQKVKRTDDPSKPAQPVRSFPAYVAALGKEHFSNIYKTDTAHVDEAVRFSWPLFLDDLWNGIDVWQKTKHTPTEEEKESIEILLQELRRIVGDPKTTDTILGMQSGFFKEFLLEKKMRHMGVETLEEMETWLPHFSSFSHEASKRNQIPAQVEQVRREYGKKWKENTMREVIREVVGHPHADQYFNIESDPSDRLAEEDIRVSFSSFVQDFLNSIIPESDTVLFETNLQARIIHAQNNPLITKEQRKNFADVLRTLVLHKMDKKDIVQPIHVAYTERITLATAKADASIVAPEEDIRLFSDHVIENDKSRLEIGPVYRLRLAAQPLMDWHAETLRQSRTAPETEAAFLRVAEDLPEAHPLRDLFVENQLHTEIWQEIVASLGDAGANAAGFHFSEQTIDLDKALAGFPLYKDIAFLQRYTLFRVEGLGEHIDALPKETARAIIARIEHALSRVSEDQHPALRRMLFQLEQRALSDDLKRERKHDEGVFDRYLDRITRLYPEPTMERDDLLHSIATDLAHTPEQIQRVDALTYAEQVRWPDAKESSKIQQQFNAMEKTRALIGTLDPQERSQYLLWMLGGATPFRERISPEKTRLSLDGRAELLWHLTPTERRTVLYDLLLGVKGIMEANRPSRQGYGYQKDHATPWPRWEDNQDLMVHTVDRMFDTVFGSERLDPDMPEDHSTNTRGRHMLQTIFRSLFTKEPNLGRRADRMVNIVEGIGKAKADGRELRVGELLRVMLEELGVVGIKAAQVLSEQPNLLPESIRKELSSLKDSATPFSKRAVLAYLESAGWVHTTEGDHIASVKDMLGSASIKQVHKGATADGADVAIKAKRPVIEKSFEEDLALLREVLRDIRGEGFDIPSFLLSEIEHSVRAELSFIKEVDHQRAAKRVLEARGATIGLTFGGERQEIPLEVSAPLSAPSVMYPNEGEVEDIGLIVEEYVQGLSLKDLQGYQQALISQHEPSLRQFRDKVVSLYGALQLPYVEERVRLLDIDRLQAEFGLELIRQMVKDGVFHSDPHSGNLVIDLLPDASRGSQMRATLIDWGSAGFSARDAAPASVQETLPDGYDVRNHLRDFLSGLFARETKYDVVAAALGKLIADPSVWGKNAENHIRSLIDNPTMTTAEKVKRIFYDLLEQSGNDSRLALSLALRAFLKTIATGADHLDKLREAVDPEVVNLMKGRAKENTLLPKLVSEGLLNVSLLL